MREALDQAASSVGQRFRSAPIEQQAIRITLARLYDDLGLPDLAATEATAALKLSPDSAQGAEARLVLAEIWIYQDQLDAAQTLLDSPVNSALPIAIDWPWRRQRLLALLLHRRGQYAASSEAYTALAGQLQMRAPDSGIYRTTLKELSESLMMQGKQETALQYLDLVTAAETPELGERHPVSLATQHARATVLRHLGRFDEAHTALLSITGLRREVLGNTHPETLRSLSEQATVLQELHRYEEAEALFKEVLSTRLQLIGEQHIETRNSMSNLGLLYSLWGKLDLAAPLYERVLAIELPLNDKPHPDTIALMHNIAGLYRKQRRIEAALNMHQRAIDAATASMGADAWQTGMFHIGKAQTLQSAQRYAESALHFDAGISAMQASLGEHHARVAKARSLKAAMTAQWMP